MPCFIDGETRTSEYHGPSPVVSEWQRGDQTRAPDSQVLLSPLPCGEAAAWRAASSLSHKIALGVVFIDRLQHSVNHFKLLFSPSPLK